MASHRFKVVLLVLLLVQSIAGVAYASAMPVTIGDSSTVLVESFEAVVSSYPEASPQAEHVSCHEVVVSAISETSGCDNCLDPASCCSSCSTSGAAIPLLVTATAVPNNTVDVSLPVPSHASSISTGQYRPPRLI